MYCLGQTKQCTQPFRSSVENFFWLKLQVVMNGLWFPLETNSSPCARPFAVAVWYFLQWHKAGRAGWLPALDCELWGTVTRTAQSSALPRQPWWGGKRIHWGSQCSGTANNRHNNNGCVLYENAVEMKVGQPDSCTPTNSSQTGNYHLMTLFSVFKHFYAYF